MRYLVDAAHAERALAAASVRLLERYSAFVLVEAASPPRDVPRAAIEPVEGTAISVHGRAIDVPEGVFTLEDAAHVLLRFIGPIAPRWKAALAKAAVEIQFFAPPYGACVRLPEGLDADALRERFPFVAGAQPYLEQQCARAVAAPPARVRRDTGALPGVFDLVCFSREARVRVEDELARRKIEVLASSSSKLRVRFGGDPAELRDLVGVKLVGAARAPKLTSANALAESIGIRVAEDAWPVRQDGRGQIVAVADTGLDRGSGDPGALHPDFAGRVRRLFSWPINASWDSFVDNPRQDDGGADLSSGHGTYIAGLVLSDGARSAGQHRGLAPAAELVFQAVEQRADVKAARRGELPSGYYLAGRPLDLRQLFLQARAAGARIHVNAWGDPADGHYTDDSFEADLFLRDHRDALIVFAAGNEASDRNADRELDPSSLFAPASAKNVVAIGATEGPESGVGWRATWSDLDPTGVRFRAASDRVDPLSGEPGKIALFSCTGPTADGRIKPDLCAPGTNLVAARSQATAARGWSLASPLPYYMFDGGTSAATGVAGGYFALLRQAWQEERGVAPSGAALKALAVLGAQVVTSRRDGGEESRFVAGFGRLDLAAALPRSRERELCLVDELDPGLETGEVREVEFVHTGQAGFRAVLAWYDAPGERLVNDLDLALVGLDGIVAWGNHARGSPGAPDRVNTVERVDLASLAPGTYRLRVSARNVPDGPQPFALAYTLPRARGPDVPVEMLSGIGVRISARLARAGITRLGELRGLALAELRERLGSGASADKVRAKLTILFQALVQPLEPDVPPGTTLAEVLADRRPPGAGVTSWEELRSRLLTLSLVFDKRAPAQIALAQLFT